MNEPQVWTMVVGTIAAFLTLIGLMTTWFTRLLTTQFATLHARFETIDARFEAIEVKLGHLDRDVQALTKNVFHQPE